MATTTALAELSTSMVGNLVTSSLYEEYGSMIVGGMSNKADDWDVEDGILAGLPSRIPVAALFLFRFAMVCQFEVTCLMWVAGTADSDLRVRMMMKDCCFPLSLRHPCLHHVAVATSRTTLNGFVVVANWLDECWCCPFAVDVSSCR
jgi:hypothetical protein